MDAGEGGEEGADVGYAGVAVEGDGEEGFEGGDVGEGVGGGRGGGGGLCSPLLGGFWNGHGGDFVDCMLCIYEENVSFLKRRMEGKKLRVYIGSS